MSIRQTIAIVVLAGSCLAVASLSQAAEPLQTRDRTQLHDSSAAGTKDRTQKRDRIHK